MIIIFKNKLKLALISFLFISFLIIPTIISTSKNTCISVSSKNKKYIAIIIDDFGNNSAGTSEMLSLPIKYTGAVMPSMPYTQKECELLNSCGKEVILHLPMEAHNGKISWLGPTPILNNFSAEKTIDILKSNLSQIKYCKGINNHMGSLVSENKKIMSAILSVAKEENLIFADSVTSSKSQSFNIANSLGVRTYKRDVFLDSTQNVEKIKQNLLKTAEIAKENGYAIAIGHVGAEGGIATYKAIKSVYKDIENQNIEFVTLSNLP